MARNIADLALDEVALHLIAGDVLQITGGERFSLSLPGRPAILAFYAVSPSVRHGDVNG